MKGASGMMPGPKGDLEADAIVLLRWGYPLEEVVLILESARTQREAYEKSLSEENQDHS